LTQQTNSHHTTTTTNNNNNSDNSCFTLTNAFIQYPLDSRNGDGNNKDNTINSSSITNLQQMKQLLPTSPSPEVMIQKFFRTSPLIDTKTNLKMKSPRTNADTSIPNPLTLPSSKELIQSSPKKRRLSDEERVSNRRNDEISISS
jgi:hypothetical protein